MKIIVVLLIITALVLFYVYHGRSWLKSKPWTKRFFEIIEPWEIALWKKSSTILLARYLQIMGLLIPMLQFLGAVDFTPLLHVVPEQYRIWLVAVISIIGFLQQFLRYRTTMPIELKAVPETKAPPEVKAAVVTSELVTAEAVAVVEAAKK